MIEIYTLSDLQGMNTVLTEDYVLMNDIDASDTINWNSGEGFIPIGTGWWADQFQGTFDGQGYVISNLYINRPSSNFQGLFGSIRTGSGTFIKNVGLIDCEIYGNERVGTLIGLNRGILSNSFATGEITGNYATGGLVGESDTLIENCYSKMTITVSSNNGGIVGNSTSTINKCYHSGLITGSAGTKNGISSSGTVTNSFWDTETSLTSTSDGGGTGKTTSEMKDLSTYTDTTTTGLDDPWDFVSNPNDDVSTDDIWNILSSLNDGYPIFDYQASIPEGTTNSATNITHESARLNGELVDPAGEAVDLFFSYKLVSDSTWTEIQKHSSIISPYTFHHDLTGLTADTDYEFQAIFKWSTNEITGQILQFKTNITPQTPVVNTSNVSNNTGTSVTFNGELTQLGAESSADLYFEYKKQIDSTWIEVVSEQNVTTEPYSYNEIATGLTEGVFYDYRSVVKWNSSEYKGNIIEFFTSTLPSLYFTKNGIEIPDGKTIVFEDTNQEEPWRLIKSNEDLIIQKYVGGTWIDVHVFSN